MSSRWRETTELIYSRGDYPYIPLMGTKEIINYNPHGALRQLGYPMMNILDEQLLRPFIIYGNYLKNANEIIRILQAWNKVRKKTNELDKKVVVQIVFITIDSKIGYIKFQ